MIHLRKSSLNILNWRSTSRIKTLMNVRILALKSVERIPLMAEKNLVEVGISLAPIPILYRNQVDTL
jgi:hypothetical protein